MELQFTGLLCDAETDVSVAEAAEAQKQCTSPLSTEEEEPMDEGPAFWDSEEEEEEEATEAELAIGEEYLAIPQMYLFSSTYQHFMEPQNCKIFHEKLLSLIHI